MSPCIMHLHLRYFGTLSLDVKPTCVAVVGYEQLLGRVIIQGRSNYQHYYARSLFQLYPNLSLIIN